MKMFKLMVTLFSFALCSCSTLNGVVNKANYYSMPILEPTVIPATNNNDCKDVPVVGDFFSVENGLGMEEKKRGFFNWNDPEIIKIVKPKILPLVNRVVYAKSTGSKSSLESTHSISLNSGTKGVQIADGVLNVQIGANNKLEVKNVNHISLDIGHYDYLNNMLSIAQQSSDHIGFVSGLLVADIFSNTNVGIDANYKGQVLDPALSAAFSQKYSGLGIVIGTNLSKIIGYGKQSTNSSHIDKQNAPYNSLFRMAFSVAPNDYIYLVDSVAGSDNKVKITFLTPIFGAKNKIQHNDKVIESNSIVIDNAKGDTLSLTYISAGANSAYGADVILRVIDITSGNINFTPVTSNVGFVKWMPI